MAKEERGKIRGFYFEIDGGEETLQEGLKNFGMALGRALSGPHRPTKPALPAPKAQGKHEDDGDGAAEEVEAEVDVFDGAEAAAEDGNGKKKKKATGSRKAPMPSIIELNLEGSEGTPLKKFAEEKQPEGLADRCLLVTYWLKHYGNVEEVDQDHVYTCFKIMDWPNPSSYTTLFSDMRNKQKSLDKGTAPGTYRINIHGENLVAKMGSET